MAHWTFAMLLGAALALAPSGPARAAAPAGPRYDVRAEALVLPYLGAPPELAVRVGERPPVFELTLTGRLVAIKATHQALLSHPSVADWAVSPRDGGARVTIHFKQRLGEVDLRLDRKRQAIVLTPIYPGKQVAPYAMPAGPLPLPPEGRRAERREAPTPAPSPTPSPQPLPLPLAPSPAPSPTPMPPSPSPAPRLSGALGLSYTPVRIDETNPGGDLLVTAETARMLGARYDMRFLPPAPWDARLTPQRWSPYWRASIEAYSLAYVMQDINLPFSYRFREDTRLELSLMREITREKLWLEAGLGYFVRLEEALHTGVAPDLSQAFSYNRLFHAPMLKLSASVPPERVVIGGVRGWRLLAELDWAPRLATAIDKGLPALPGLGFMRTRAGIERDFGPVRARLAYDTWLMSGTGFEERWSARSLTLSWTTAWP